MAKLFLRTDGSIEGLYTDQINLQELGRLNVIRATNVEFEANRQEWLVTLPNGKEILSNQNRQVALNKEQEYCETQLKNGFRVKNLA